MSRKYSDYTSIQTWVLCYAFAFALALAIVCNVHNGVIRYLDTTWVACWPQISNLTLALLSQWVQVPGCKPSDIKIPVRCHRQLLSCHQCHLEFCMNITTHYTFTHITLTIHEDHCFAVCDAMPKQNNTGCFLLLRFMLTFISHSQWVTYLPCDEGCS